MIAKKTALQNTRGAGSLIKYIAAAKEKGEKLESFWMTNCYAGTELSDIDIAIAEIKATQNLNMTSKADPNYHLVVSFAEGEKPDLQTLKDIEREFADALGFADHQRVVGTHINTENFHMHIMFNKVHPETFKMHTPFRDFKILADKCAELEKKYGLQIVKGRDGERQFNNHKASDREAHTWEKSFSTFLKDNKDLILSMKERSSSWAEFHEKLDEIGVLLKLRGNGFVFADNRPDSNLYERASRVDRSLSKAALEKIFGPFIPIEKDLSGRKTDENRQYQKEPLDPKLKSHPAWKLFRKQKKHRWRGFLESMSPQNAEVREALAIQEAYLSIFFGTKAPKIKERAVRPRKGRSR